MYQEMSTLKDEVLMETATYEEWARTAAYRLSLTFKSDGFFPLPGSDPTGSGHEARAGRGPASGVPLAPARRLRLPPRVPLSRT